MKRVIFLGSKAIGASCLHLLLAKQAELSIELIGVVTKPNKLDGKESVAQLINDFDLPTFNSVKDIPSCDIILSVQHHEILKQEDIYKAREVAVNLHMAPLPEYRGCNQFSFAILDQKTEFGTTLHVMTTGIDDGAIIAERRFAISEDIWVEDLYYQTLEESKLLFAQNVERLISGNYKATPQKELLAARGCSHHYREEIEKIKKIDEKWPQEKKKRHVRATFMKGFEPPYSIQDGEKVYYNKESF